MIEGFPYEDALLPKVWLQKIPGFGELTIPKNYPESSSEFSLDFTAEETDVIRAMEANLNTEESIITPEDIPENEKLSLYLGSYNVNGEPGELTLLNPNKIGNKDTDAVAYHFISSENDESTGVWEKIEDTQVSGVRRRE